MLYGAEMLGTALLVVIGLSIVILNFGEGNPMIGILPDPSERRLITGFLFGTTGTLITLSPLGKESGAHVNPAVTLGFWLMGKLQLCHAVGYVLAQLAGAAVGALPLLAWGDMGRSVDFGATVPNASFGVVGALLGEVATTFVLIFGLFFFLQHRRLRTYTPALFPFMYAVMVFIEANVSGTSTNPARSFGPALISDQWHGWWVYWLGPLLGTLLAVATLRTAGRHWPMIPVAKFRHFEHDRYGVFGLGTGGIFRKVNRL